MQFDRDKSQPLSHKIELQAAAKLCGRLLAKQAARQAGGEEDNPASNEPYKM